MHSQQTATIKKLQRENKELTTELNELEDELFETLHSLVVNTLKYQKLCELTNTDPDSITVDEGEVINEFQKLHGLESLDTFERLEALEFRGGAVA